MNNIQASLENLIKTNNGFFKSDAQKAAQGLSADKPNAAHFVKTVEILVDRR